MGARRAGAVAAVLMLVLAALIPIPALAAHYRVGYLVVMELVVVPILLVGSMRVADSDNRRDFAFTSRALKLGMFVGIVAIAAGA
jgi:4-hydroxybenzoate polyprenyltransferase